MEHTFFARLVSRNGELIQNNFLMSLQRYVSFIIFAKSFDENRRDIFVSIVSNINWIFYYNA